MLAIDSFSQHLSGIDVLFHCAAYYREYMKSRTGGDLLEQINVSGTIGLFEAARDNGIRNIIFVSSGGVVDVSGSGVPVSETAPFDDDTENLYFKSKIRAERKVEHFLDQHDDVRVVVVRPSLMMGPGDAAPTPAGQFIVNFLNRKIPVVLPGRMVIADVRDVAHAMVTAVEKGQSGDRFFLGGKAHSLSDVLATLEHVSGVPGPRKRPPYPVAYFMLPSQSCSAGTYQSGRQISSECRQCWRQIRQRRQRYSVTTQERSKRRSTMQLSGLVSTPR